MRAPVIVVTGGTASGKTTVAKAMAGDEGTLVDCDRIGHEVLERDEVAQRVIDVFGHGITFPNGRIDRKKLAAVVFSSRRHLERLNAIIKPELKRVITDKVLSLREKSKYIVLDAVLFFQYKFRFKADLVVATYAPVETRVERLVRRDRLSVEEARKRIELQGGLEKGWRMADYTVNTDRDMDEVIREVVELRKNFLKDYYHL